MRHTAMAKRHFQTGNDWNRLQLFWEQAALQRLLSLTLGYRSHNVRHQAVIGWPPLRISRLANLSNCLESMF